MRIAKSLNITLFCYLFLLTCQALLSQNGYYTSYQGALNNPADVETLDVSSEQIGNELYLFKELKTLIIREGSLDSITAQISTLSNLEEVTIVSSNLKYVSPNLFSLVNIKGINLSGNLLTNVAFQPNNSIEFLDLSYNDLVDVDSIHFLKKIEILILGGNELDKFIPCKTFWNNMISLDISNNDLSSIGISVAEAEGIQNINLRNNKISSFPKALLLLPNMERLHLAGNLISDIPNNWLEAKSLNWLDLSGNPIICQETVTFNQLLNLILLKCLCSDCVFISQNPDFKISQRTR